MLIDKANKAPGHCNSDQNLEKQRTLCLQCLRSTKVCFCHDLKSFDTLTEFLILMHPKEAKKQKVGTGRYSHLLLKNSKLEIGVSFDQCQILRERVEDPEAFTAVVYPGKKSQKLDQTFAEFCPSTKKLCLILIDGTWPMALKMMRETKLLHDLPWVSFENNLSSKFSIKQQPHELCLSTIESLAVVIQKLIQIEREDPETPYQRLNQVLDRIVEQQRGFEASEDSGRYRPGKFLDSGTRKKIQKKRLKTKKRSLFFRLREDIE